MGAVHLSFDNGPHADGTPLVLDVLARHGLTATFFVLGRELATDTGRALAQATVDAGHRLGNHSWNHAVPLGEDATPDAVERELAATQALVDTLLDGDAPRWFRPFGGGGHLGPHLLSGAAVDWLQATGSTVVLWNAVPGDWRDPDGWVDTALQQVEAQDDTLLVLHDIVPEAMAHLDRFLHTLVDRGHTFTDRLPSDCVPLLQGVPRPGLDRFVTPHPGAPR